MFFWCVRAKKRCVCGGIAACIDMPMWSHMSGMSAHFHVRARVCLSIHHLCIVCVDCISIFILCVCPPFLKREAMLCMNMVDSWIVVAMSWIYTFLLLLGVCVCVVGCGCVKHTCLVWPAPAPARSEAPVTCKVAKGEWRTCEQQQKKTKKGCWFSTSFAGFPTTRGLGVGSVGLVCMFFFWGGVYLLWRRHERAARANREQCLQLGLHHIL